MQQKKYIQKYTQTTHIRLQYRTWRGKRPSKHNSIYIQIFNEHTKQNKQNIKTKKNLTQLKKARNNNSTAINLLSAQLKEPCSKTKHRLLSAHSN